MIDSLPVIFIKLDLFCQLIGMRDIFDDDDNGAILMRARSLDDGERKCAAVESVPVGLALFFRDLKL